VPALDVVVSSLLHHPGCQIRTKNCTTICILRLANEISRYHDLDHDASIAGNLDLSPLCATAAPRDLAKSSKSTYINLSSSAERIGLARESGLADDLLQNPMPSRRR